MKRTGKCLCGAVTFTAKDLKPEASACHCGMCLRWSGGPWIGVMVGELELAGDPDALGVIQSSAWAERGFCTKCGAGLYYRLTVGSYEGVTSVSLGSLDDRSGFTLSKEWFIDDKPDTYDLAGERPRVTSEEVMEMFKAGL